MASDVSRGSKAWLKLKQRGKDIKDVLIGKPRCSYPECNKSCYEVERGIFYQFCGRTHAEQYKTLFGHSTTGVDFSPQLSHKSQDAPGDVMCQTTTDPIRFYNRGEPYYEFTNFYPAVIKIDGKDWPSSEHYFQAQKFIGTPYVEYIRKLQSPRMAFEFTRDQNVHHWARYDWDKIKIRVMYKALIAKFLQHGTLKDQLLGTNDRDLIEHTPYDTFWGNGGNDTGKNMLGRLLVILRSELRGELPPGQGLPRVSNHSENVEDLDQIFPEEEHTEKPLIEF